MRNILTHALREHLNKHSGNTKKMNDYYANFKASEDDILDALSGYADLVFNFGVEEDTEMNPISAGKVVEIGLTLKGLCGLLSLAQYGRESTEIHLNRKQGGKDEN